MLVQVQHLSLENVKCSKCKLSDTTVTIQEENSTTDLRWKVTVKTHSTNAMQTSTGLRHSSRVISNSVFTLHSQDTSSYPCANTFKTKPSSWGLKYFWSPAFPVKRHLILASKRKKQNLKPKTTFYYYKNQTAEGAIASNTSIQCHFRK